MKTIFKSLILSVVIVTALNCMANAQSMAGKKFKDMTPQQRADFQTGMMKSKLKLDTQQIVKVKAVNIRYAEKFQPIIKSDDSRFSKLHQAMKLQDQKDDELKGIFTSAQFKQYKDFENDMRKKIQDKASE